MLSRITATLPVEVVEEIPSSLREHLYQSDRFAMPSQSNDWSQTIVKDGRFVDASRSYKFADGAQALLPLYRPRFRPKQLSVLSSPPPSWGFGGLLSDAPLGTGHVSAVLQDLASSPYAAVKIRPNPLHDRLWSDAANYSGWTSVPRNAHILDLSGGFNEVWQNRFPGKTRSKVRRAQKAGITVSSGQSENLIADFDHLFRKSVQRWALKQNEFSWLANARARLRDPKAKFFAMANNARSVFTVWIAYLQDKPVAGIVVLMGNNAHYTRGAMDQSLIGNTYANYLLHSMAIEAACETGCLHYHMGETGDSQSLAQFKSGFGACSTPYAEYMHERIPILSADKKLRSTVKKMIGFKDA
jgi:GNAT acetyltransferase-like protein